MNAAGASSSSPELSTPPGSPDLADSATSAANGSHHASTIHVLGGALPNNVAPTSSAKYNPNTNPTTAPTTTTTTTTATTVAGTKRPRKKKEPAAPAAGEEKPKATRRPRQPKDPNAPPTQRGKKRKTAAEPAAPAPAPAPAVDEKPVPQPQQSQQPQQPSSRQPKITDLVGSVPAQPSPPIPQPAPEQPIPNPSLSQVAAATPGPSTPRPASSGQLYDPIRSSTVPVTQHQHASAVPPVSPSSRVINRASASPSINSLIDPPAVPSQPHLSQQARFQAPLAVTSAPASPAPLQASQNPFGPTAQPIQAPQPSPVQTSPVEVALEVQKPTPPKKTETASTASSTAVITPPAPAQKPEKKKEAPPMPTGSGLLSGMPFAGAMMNTKPETEGTNIWLTFPLKGQTNVTINFAREVEKKYGFAAMHPRIAAAKERRRQMAAATAALEKGSGAASADDMSVDLSEPESNVEMGGMDEELTQSGTVRKRKKKVEDYDKDDDFIDDTELAWEQSALMAKDGFFVYSGPLVTEGEKPAVERADGTMRRGRGRGRGGTSRGEASGRGNRGGNGGGGRARGGNTVRKPRVTKADRAMMEQEKLEREKMAQTLAAKPMTPYPGVAS